MLTASSLRNMIPPAGGWPSLHRQVRTAATIGKQHGQAYTGNIGRHWFTCENGVFRPCPNATLAYCRYVSAMAFNRACAEPAKSEKRRLLAVATRWRKDAIFIAGHMLP